MNYQSTDAFAGGFARGFGLVNSAIESKENRQYRKQMMGMHKVEHERKIRKEDVNYSPLKERVVASSSPCKNCTLSSATSIILPSIVEKFSQFRRDHSRLVTKNSGSAQSGSRR